jgi:hypothetical protein
MGERFSFDDVRLLGALGLLLVLGIVFIPRAADAQPGGAGEPQPENALAGEPAGTAWPVEALAEGPSLIGDASAPSATPQPTPPPTPTPSPTATPEPTPVVAESGTGADIMACRSIAGASCQGELTQTQGLGSFTALVLLSDTRSGDVVQAALIGAGGTFSGGGYTVGGGDGYYYSTFAIGGVPRGEYALVATINGVEMDRANLVID